MTSAYVDHPTSVDPHTNLIRHLDGATAAALSGLHQYPQRVGDLPAAEAAVQAAHDDLVEAIGVYRAAVAAAVVTPG